MTDRVAETVLILLALSVVFVPLERMHAARTQPIFRRGWGTDLLFFGGQYLVFVAAVTALLHRAQPRVVEHVPGTLLDAVAALPVWLQLGLCVVLGDVLVYGLHRAMHRYDILWRFHAAHHTSTDVDWLASYREHPVDGLLTQGIVNLPALALAVDLRWMAPIVIFRGAWALFIHSNVALPLGPIGVLFGDPRLHRWHHTGAGGRSNYANLAPYLDLLFGTHTRPSAESLDDERWRFGTEERWAHGYLAHLVLPLLPRRWWPAAWLARSLPPGGIPHAAEGAAPFPDGLEEGIRRDADDEPSFSRAPRHRTVDAAGRAEPRGAGLPARS